MEIKKMRANNPIALIAFAVITNAEAQKVPESSQLLKSYEGLAKELRDLRLNQEVSKSPKSVLVELASTNRKRNEESLNNVLRLSLATASSIYSPNVMCDTSLTLGTTAGCKPIYGLPDGDNRKNLDDPSLTKWQIQAAKATLAVVFGHKFQWSKDGKMASLPSVNVMSNGLGLCTPMQSSELKLPVERFYDEANPAHCSAFVVGPRMIATAAHCMKSEEVCTGSKFVAGFYKSKGKPRPETDIPASSIYQCKRILAKEFSDGGIDWAIVEADRDIIGPVVTIRTKKQGAPLIGEGVTVIGYPMGLPGKIADGATIRSTEEKYFIANLDTYGGNSGSAVFNTKKLANGSLFVEGVLVRGEDDFAQTTPCFASKYCPIGGCRGEDVVYAQNFEAVLLQAKTKVAMKN